MAAATAAATPASKPDLLESGNVGACRARSSGYDVSHGLSLAVRQTDMFITCV